MSGISTHVLDTANGKPAAGIPVSLFQGHMLINLQVTNRDGRIPVMLPPDFLFSAGVYRLVFDTSNCFPDTFFPEVNIVFEVKDAGTHYHVPLLLSPYGYSTYRGS